MIGPEIPTRKRSQIEQKLSLELWQQLFEGLLYNRSQLNASKSKTLEATAFLYALIELLDERGIVRIEDLDEGKRAVGQGLVQQFRRNGDGIVLQESEGDKYKFEGAMAIDCCRGLSLCRAACCRLPFVM